MPTSATASVEHAARAAPVLLNRVLVSEFLANVRDFVYFKDRESRYRALSLSLVRCFGCTHPIEVIGRSNFDFFSKENAQASFDDELEIMRTGRPLIDKLEEKIWPDGHSLWLRITKLPLHDESGEIIGTFGISRDVTATHRLESELAATKRSLVEASRAAGMAEGATGVLHNVGNVLSSLNTSAALLGAGLRAARIDRLPQICALVREHGGDLGKFVTQDPRGRKFPAFIASLASHTVAERDRLLGEITALQRNIDHIKEIVAMQQDYATTAGLVEPLAPIGLLEDALRLHSGAPNQSGVRVVREFQSTPAVLGERGKILQILVNLLRNAKYACHDGPHADRIITVRLASAPGSIVRFTVSDNGVGIPAENLTRIFGHGFTTRKHGHGFGLHSSANAAREMKGTLLAHSAGPGQGATFTLDLPAAQPALP